MSGQQTTIGELKTSTSDNQAFYLQRDNENQLQNTNNL